MQPADPGLHFAQTPRHRAAPCTVWAHVLDCIWISYDERIFTSLRRPALPGVILTHTRHCVAIAQLVTEQKDVTSKRSPDASTQRPT